MRIIIIGRTKVLLDSLKLLQQNGHQIVGIITSKAGARDFLIKLLEACSSYNDISFLHTKDLILK